MIVGFLIHRPDKDLLFAWHLSAAEAVIGEPLYTTDDNPRTYQTEDGSVTVEMVEWREVPPARHLRVAA
jgi:hypothetical protein